jgi:hypothetical protein
MSDSGLLLVVVPSATGAKIQISWRPVPRRYTGLMCRNIRTLFNFEPPATEEEIRSASLQFVRKLSGFTKPSKANEAAFTAAVEDIAGIAGRLIESLTTTAAPRDREEWAAQAKARAAQRYGTAQ